MTQITERELLAAFSKRRTKLAASTPRPPHPEDYRPYNTMKEFRDGFEARRTGNYRSPYDANSAAWKAWDCGLDYAMRLAEYERAGR